MRYQFFTIPFYVLAAVSAFVFVYMMMTINLIFLQILFGCIGLSFGVYFLWLADSIRTDHIQHILKKNGLWTDQWIKKKDLPKTLDKGKV